MNSEHIRTPVLDVAYESDGDPNAQTVVLLHGFPYDVRAFERVAPVLAEQGLRVIVPYLRGFGLTRFLHPETIRSGQQAALGRDLIELLDALGIDQAIVAGFDWGGRAACIASALSPERITGLVTVDGYNIQDIATYAVEPGSPEWESKYWYQYYFQTERGRNGLAQNREELCRHLWQSWSPTWATAAKEFEVSAHSLQNPDFVDVAIHSYRHRFNAVAGDPRYDEWEQRLALQPPITVPTVILETEADGLGPRRTPVTGAFTGPNIRTKLPNVGHNAPQESPAAFAQAVLDVHRLALEKDAHLA